MNICVIGAGYVGLTTGACLAETGHVVTVVDNNKEKIHQLVSTLKAPFYEPGLNELIVQTAQTPADPETRGRVEYLLNFSTDLEMAIRHNSFDAYFICVGTPDRYGKPDLSQVFNVAEIIRTNHVVSHAVVVIKSTVPPGTSVDVHEKVLARNGYLHIAFNPEFLKEGHALEDFRKPDRIVVAGGDQVAEECLRDIYSQFIRAGHAYMEMDLRSAEMVKYAANAMLATRISFINEIAYICEKTGADVMEVRRGIGADDRIGPKFLYPGLGFGGSCFPKDLNGLISMCSEADAKILHAVRDVNERLPIRYVDLFSHALNEMHITQAKVCIWGIAFKPRTDDTREAQSLKLADALLFTRRVKKLTFYDPVAYIPNDFLDRNFNDKEKIAQEVASKYHAAKDADVLILATEWPEFRKVHWHELAKYMATPKIIIDTRNQWDPDEVIAKGFQYFAIGR